MKKDKAALLASAGALAAAWAALQLAPHGENLASFFTGLGFGLMAGAIFWDAEKGTSGNVLEAVLCGERGENDAQVH